MLYHNEAKDLNVDMDTLYAALLADAENEPPEWDIQGRQAGVYKYDVPSYASRIT
jgi:hypothetical protein